MSQEYGREYKRRYNRIKDLQKQLRAAETCVVTLKTMIKEETKQLQDMCEHEFLAERDGDCHSPGWYYTCKHCAFFTTQKPKNNIL